MLKVEDRPHVLVVADIPRDRLKERLHGLRRFHSGLALSGVPASGELPASGSRLQKDW